MISAAILMFVQAAVVQADDRAVHAALVAAHQFQRDKLLDEFAESRVDKGIVGTRFRVVSLLSDVGLYSYEDGALQLIYTLDRKSNGLLNPTRLVGKIATRKVPGQSYVGSNSFGVRAHVRVVHSYEDGIAMISRPTGLESPFSKDGFRDQLQHYWVKLSLPASDARVVAASAKVVIEGNVALMPGGQLTECEAHVASATIDSPTDLFWQVCWIGASIDRIAIIDGRTDAVLQEWKEPYRGQ